MQGCRVIERCGYIFSGDEQFIHHLKVSVQAVLEARKSAPKYDVSMDF